MQDTPWTYKRDYITKPDQIYQILEKNIQRKQYPIKLFGKTYMQPRLISFFADTWLQYRYSQTILTGSWRPDYLCEMKQKLIQDTGIVFNSVLINLYRDNNDSMWRHSDDEVELWPDPVIASITLGNPRKFSLRHKQSKKRIDIILENGSLLLMKKGSQIQREHSIPKTTKILWPRINLTRRYIHTTTR